MEMNDAKQRAKLIISEIIRQAGRELRVKSDLDRAFYHAHLIYVETQPGYLSEWPLVKMEHGPSIANVDALLGELTTEGVLRVKQVSNGNGSAFAFELAETANSERRLEPESLAAISEAVQVVTGESASRPSDQRYVQSRACREARIGEKLMIYCDPVPEEEYRATESSMNRTAEALRQAWSATGSQLTDTTR